MNTEYLVNITKQSFLIRKDTTAIEVLKYTQIQK
jgi:hypothetical protein